MPEIVETVRVAEDADALWREIGRFGAVGQWHPMLAKVETDGERAGCLRRAQTRDGDRQTDRLLETAPQRHLYRYRMEASPMPVRNYVGELRVVDNGDGTSKVAWSARFQVTSTDDGGTAETVRNFLRVGLENLRSLHGGTRASSARPRQQRT